MLAFLQWQDVEHPFAGERARGSFPCRHTTRRATRCRLQHARLDNATWFLSPTMLTPSQYGCPQATHIAPSAPYTNTLVIDDVISDQFLYRGASQTFAPSPIGSVWSSARITQYSRGLGPRPDPNNGLPVLAIVGVGPALGIGVAVHLRRQLGQPAEPPHPRPGERARTRTVDAAMTAPSAMPQTGPPQPAGLRGACAPA